MLRAPFLSSAIVALSAFLLAVPDVSPAAAPMVAEKSDDTALFGAMRDADLRLGSIAWRWRRPMRPSVASAPRRPAS